MPLPELSHLDDVSSQVPPRSVHCSRVSDIPVSVEVPVSEAVPPLLSPAGGGEAAVPPVGALLPPPDASGQSFFSFTQAPSAHFTWLPVHAAVPPLLSPPDVSGLPRAGAMCPGHASAFDIQEMPSLHLMGIAVGHAPTAIFLHSFAFESHSYSCRTPFKIKPAPEHTLAACVSVAQQASLAQYIIFPAHCSFILCVTHVFVLTPAAFATSHLPPLDWHCSFGVCAGTGRAAVPGIIGAASCAWAQLLPDASVFAMVLSSQHPHLAVRHSDIIHCRGGGVGGVGG